MRFMVCIYICILAVPLVLPELDPFCCRYRSFLLDCGCLLREL